MEGGHASSSLIDPPPLYIIHWLVFDNPYFNKILYLLGVTAKIGQKVKHGHIDKGDGRVDEIYGRCEPILIPVYG